MDKEIELEEIKHKILTHNKPAQWRLDLIPLYGSRHDTKSWTIYNNMVPITPHLQYPWHPNPLGVDDNLEKSLRESHERERYLERIIQSQANQLKEPTVQNALNTLENIYLYNQNELKIHHSNQVDKLKSQLNILSRKKDKLDVILNHLNRLESTNENDDDWSVKDRKSLLRKLRLNELRLAVKNVELEALVHKQNNDHPPTNNNLTNLSLLADKLLQQDHHKRLLDEEDDNHRKRYKLTTEKHWTEKEDELLLGLIQKSGINDWQLISTNYFPHHTPLECFQRYEIMTKRLPSISALLK